jgi:hypothetical protein
VVGLVILVVRLYAWVFKMTLKMMAIFVVFMWAMCVWSFYALAWVVSPDKSRTSRNLRQFNRSMNHMLHRLL